MSRPFGIYRGLRTVNPSPYMYYIAFEDFALVGSSPEPLIKVDHGWVETRPIAGTRPRGATPDEDKRLAEDLLADEKERAEHIMLVDLGRNDLGRVCVPGTVEVVDLMRIEYYSHVMHIVSVVVGKLRDGMKATDALKAAFPAGTVSGAPKIRSMEIINELEPSQARLLCRRHRLPELPVRRAGHLHLHPHHRGQGRRRLRAGGRRRGRRLGAGAWNMRRPATRRGRCSPRSSWRRSRRSGNDGRNVQIIDSGE